MAVVKRMSQLHVLSLLAPPLTDSTTQSYKQCRPDELQLSPHVINTVTVTCLAFQLTAYKHKLAQCYL